VRHRRIIRTVLQLGRTAVQLWLFLNDPGNKNMKSRESTKTARRLVLAVAITLTSPSLIAAETESTAESAVTMNELLKMLQDQQAQLNAQSEQISTQSQLISELRAQSDGTVADQKQKLIEQENRIDEQRKAMQSMQARIDELSDFDPAALSDDEIALRDRLETLESSISESQKSDSTTFDAESFPGSIPIPGSTAAVRIGGFVKMNIVQNFDTVGSKDRFIVGTIPTDPESGGDSEASLTVSQSRLNVDLRDQTSLGVMRAYVEGDFAGEADTFRLRSAFGQFRDVLAGKTWSTFTDREAAPEEIDFEGINGKINVRQAQIRYFPRIGKDWNLLVSFEDPAPDVTGGDGISQIPDTVISARRTWFDRWHVKSGILLRQIRARWGEDSSIKQKETGWGLTLSAKTSVPRWDRRDNLIFQVNFGTGYGRYVNDLATVGGQDAVFDDNGDMKALDVLASYAAFQKWWKDGLRSTFIASFVNVDNHQFQDDDAYHKTQRLSGNLIWSPTPRIDIGGEFLWGKRYDKDGATGDAVQVQLSSTYRF
jgi:hypothetical protein